MCDHHDCVDYCRFIELNEALDRLRTENATLRKEYQAQIDANVALVLRNVKLRSLIEEILLEKDVRGLDMSHDLIEDAEKALKEH